MVRPLGAILLPSGDEAAPRFSPQVGWKVRASAAWSATPRISYDGGVKSALLLALPVAAGCCPPDGVAPGTYYVATDLGANVDDAGCAKLCLSAASQSYSGVYGVESCQSRVVDAGVDEITCNALAHTYCGGRLPAGFSAVALSAHEIVGEWLARTAALETASVPAFRILANELRAHGAPDVLVGAALRCAEQEVRHAAAVTRLARRFGAAALPIELALQPVRSLEALVVENAVEGRVREAYGARLAAEQARTAGDAEVRAAFATIAPEERGHAELAGAVDQWARGKLSSAARRRVDEAREQARARLARDLEGEAAPTLRQLLGLPSATRAQDLVAAL
jgi:hypothetical protein